MKSDRLLWFLGIIIFLIAGGFFAVYVRYKSRRDFMESILADAQSLQSLTGIKVPIILTQAGLEAGDGNSDLVQKYHNIFGIKAGSSWTGPVAEPTTTHETVNGIKILVTETKDRRNMFRAYPTYYSAMQDWASLLARLYPDAYAAGKRGDIQGFAAGLNRGVVVNSKTGARAQYATDPTYASMLASLFPTAGEIATV